MLFSYVFNRYCVLGKGGRFTTSSPGDALVI